MMNTIILSLGIITYCIHFIKTRLEKSNKLEKGFQPCQKV